jgi:hypothetical protein
MVVCGIAENVLGHPNQLKVAEFEEVVIGS